MNIELNNKISGIKLVFSLLNLRSQFSQNFKNDYDDDNDNNMTHVELKTYATG